MIYFVTSNQTAKFDTDTGTRVVLLLQEVNFLPPSQDEIKINGPLKSITMKAEIIHRTLSTVGLSLSKVWKKHNT